MYKSWEYLEFKNDAELKSKERIAALAKARGTKVTPLVIFGSFFLIFILLAIYCLAKGLWGGEINGELIGFSMGCFLMAVFFAAGYAFLQFLRKQDIFLRYLRAPEELDFVAGSLDSFEYGAREGTTGGRITVQGKAYTPDGKELFVIEFFDPSIWKFAYPGEEEHLNSKDDWFDMKGKRSALPIPAIFLCLKKNPKVATLVGVRYEDLKNKKGSV